MTNENIFKYLNLSFSIINMNTFLVLMSHSVRIINSRIQAHLGASNRGFQVKI